MTMRAVLDTNVIISAALDTRRHLVPHGRPLLCLLLAFTGAYSLVASKELLREYEEVLRRPRFALPPARIDAFLALLRRRALLVRPALIPGDLLPDPDDLLVLATAHAAKARYLVTGNKRHFPASYGSTTILSPAEFLASILTEEMH